MHISTQNIADYLSKNKTISLEKIGVLNFENSADGNIFTYNKKAETSPEFIQYLSEQLGKPISLAQQDFEYFLDQTRQLMNIRASNLFINGYGYIYTTNDGSYAFSSHVNELQEPDTKNFEDVYAKSPLTHSIHYNRNPGKNKLLWSWIIGILVLGGIIGYAAYYIHSRPSFFTDSKDSTVTMKKDSAINQTKEDSITKQVPPQKFMTTAKGYKFIIQTFPDIASCDKRQTQLKSYGNNVLRDSISANGKSLYRLYLKDTIATAADTLRIKDSLSTYFGHAVSIE